VANKAKEYRANAAECQRMGEIARNPTDKQTWLEMAANWLRMAQARDAATTAAQAQGAPDHSSHASENSLDSAKI
jgi:hypothetical protein